MHEDPRPRRIAPPRRATGAAPLVAALWLAAAGPATADADAGAFAAPGPTPAPGVVPDAPRAAGVPDDATLEASGAVIGTITILRHNVFDTALEEEDRALFRGANRLHVVTREAVIERQLLVAPGDRYSRRLLDESARLLRAQPYLRDAEVRPVAYRDGVVDLEVETRDVWSLNPGISGGRKGGESSFGIDLEESNLFGTGAELALSRRSDAERDETALSFSDRHLLGPWVGVDAVVRENSDGDGWALGVQRPFYALDTRRSWSVRADHLTLSESLYVRGEEVSAFRQRNRDLDVGVGWSRGLVDGRTTRWSVGLRDERRQFLAALDPALAGPIPLDRHLVGPWLGVEHIRDDWATLRNYDQIAITEDALLGLRLAGRLGRAGEALGGDRDAWWFDGEASRGLRLGDAALLRVDARLEGRLEGGDAVDTTLRGRARYYREAGERRLFYATLEAQYGHALDLDGRTYLGGETGLRGYPLNWAGGEHYARLSVEQRYFTDWYPWRLFRVGGALFLDVGRTWGDDGLGTPNPGAMANVGVGLRLSNTRSAFARVIHVDLAVPVDDDPSLKTVELVIEARRAF
jgi:hemolysin activation/secretion protein